MLKITSTVFKLFPDIDMYLFLEKVMRGGWDLNLAHRYSCANNIYFNEYSDNERNKYLMYFNANNVYRRAISR